MEITILGSGTSHGIPVVACSCAVCTSSDERNRRTRASILVADGDSRILIDTATEFRLQAVREKITRLDGILYTHNHADHLHGLDDIRPLCRDGSMDIYASNDDLGEIRQRFPYIFRDTAQAGGGKPHVTTHSIDDGAFFIGKTLIEPVPVKHGILDIYGYIFNGKAAYITDCSHIPESSLTRLMNLELLILGALRYRPHATHFNIDEALEVIKKISPKRAYLTHFSHDVDHERLSNELPGGVCPAYDGLRITL